MTVQGLCTKGPAATKILCDRPEISLLARKLSTEEPRVRQEGGGKAPMNVLLPGPNEFTNTMNSCQISVPVWIP